MSFSFADVARALVGREIDGLHHGEALRGENDGAAHAGALDAEGAGGLKRSRERDLLSASQKRIDAPKRAVRAARSEEHTLVGRIRNRGETDVLIVVGIERELVLCDLALR